MKMPEKPSAMKDAEIDLEMLDNEPDMAKEEGSDAEEMMESPEEENKESAEDEMAEVSPEELASVPDGMLIEEIKKRKLKI